MNDDIARIRGVLNGGLFRFDKLAEAADVHRNTLRAATRPDWSPNVATVRKIINALDRAGKE